MTPKERFNREVWWILQEIKTEQFYRFEGDKVEFSIRTRSERAERDTPSPDTQRKLLDVLKELGAIDLRQNLTEILGKIVNSVNNDIDNNFVNDSSFVPSYKLPLLPRPPIKYILTIHQPKFDEVYRKFQKSNNLQVTTGVTKDSGQSNRYKVYVMEKNVVWNGMTKKWKSTHLKSAPATLILCEYIFLKHLNPLIKEETEVDKIAAFRCAYEGQTFDLKKLHNSYDYLRNKLAEMFRDHSPDPKKVLLWKRNTMCVSVSS